MSESMKDALEFFLTAFTELAVLFIVISTFVAWINYKLPAEKVKQLLSGNRGYGVAIGLGAVTPFCSCSTLPMTIGLIQARAAFGPVMAFLFTSPLLNPFIVGLFWVTFGVKITLIYSGFVLVLAVASGVLLEKLRFERYIKAEILNPSCKTNSDCSSRSAEDKVIGWSLLAKSAVKQFWSFAPYMIFGVAIGAFLHGYIPRSFFESIAGYAGWWLIPAAALVGAFLYIRASTMVPIAASLVAKGMSMGAIMSLTIAGAGASLPEMIMMKRMFHWPLIIAFVFLVFTTACLTGFAIDWM